MHEYTSEVFAVGLAGFAPVDDDKINAMAAEGWEPAHMTTVHGGFAAVVLFRRETQRRRRVSPSKAAAPAPRSTSRTPAAKAAKGAKGARKARSR